MLTRWNYMACLVGALTASFAIAAHARADEKEGGSAPQKKVLITNLENPSGVAVDPASGHVFVASRYAVYRYIPSTPAAMNIEIVPGQADVYGKGPKYDIGPLGVAIKGDWLIVGDGSRPDGEELVRVYKFSDKPPANFLKEDSAEFTLGPIKAGEESAKGEGNFYGVAVVGDAIFVTCNGDDTKGWIARSEIKDGVPGELKPFIATKEVLEVDAPAAATVSPDGKELVVSQMGEINVPGDSLLTFYNPADGKLIRSLKTGLSDVVGLAYSPKSGKLYATDFSWIDTSKGALYRLDIEGENVTPVKIIDLDKPAGIAFDKEGKRLYVTVFGTAEEGAEISPGTLIAIDGDL